MNRSAFVLVFLNVSLLFTTGTSPSLSTNSEETWTDFTFCSCSPTDLDIYDNQINKNGYSIDDRVEPENFTLELNITSMTDTFLKIIRHVKVMSETKNLFELDSRYISSSGHQSIILNANSISIHLVANSTTVEYHSIHGFYRLSAENGTQIINWKDFSLWNCGPTGREIFDDGNTVHNITTHLILSEIGNGTLHLHYYRGSIDAIVSDADYGSNGTHFFNEQGHNIHMVYFGENGTFVKGSYLLEDFGIMYSDIPGFPFYIPVIIAIILPLIRKRNKKID